MLTTSFWPPRCVPVYYILFVFLSSVTYICLHILTAKQLQKVQKAVICGHDGNIWAASAGFGATVEELKSIATNYGNMSVLPMSGLTVAGTRLAFPENGNTRLSLVSYLTNIF